MDNNGNNLEGLFNEQHKTVSEIVGADSADELEKQITAIQKRLGFVKFVRIDYSTTAVPMAVEPPLTIPGISTPPPRVQIQIIPSAYVQYHVVNDLHTKGNS